MLDKIVTLPTQERKNIFLKTAYELGISEPIIVEKDFWVSWALEKLFQQPINEPSLIFKGGTSLSKAYNLIDRFSEDIDITITRKDLDFLNPDEYILELGNKRRKRYFDELYNVTIALVEQKILPRLKIRIDSILTEPWQLMIDNNNYERINFSYPSCFSNINKQYLLPKIIFEFGSRGDTIPSDNITLSSYVEKVLPNLKIKSPSVTVLKPERTFWEKILILHKIAHQPNDKLISNRLSRHYYDIFMLANNGILDNAIKQPRLLLDVAQHNMAYFRNIQASYETAKLGSLRLIPSKSQIEILCHDYKLMESMFINPAPSFAQLIETTKAIENTLNN